MPSEAAVEASSHTRRNSASFDPTLATVPTDTPAAAAI